MVGGTFVPRLGTEPFGPKPFLLAVRPCLHATQHAWKVPGPKYEQHHREKPKESLTDSWVASCDRPGVQLDGGFHH